MHSDSTVWTSDWKPGSIPRIDYVWSPAGQGPWTSRDGGGEARDLGLGAASGGLLTCHEIRTITGGDLGHYAGDDDLRFVFVLDGTVDLNADNGPSERLSTWSTVCVLRGSHYTLTNASPGFRAVEIRIPGKPDAAATVDHSWRGTVTHEAPDQYVLANGPRAYFDYRDLQTRQLSEDRVHIHIVRATKPVAGGTGWHVHTMSQWFMVLRGRGTISVEGQGDLPIAAGDSMCLGAGLKHDVSEFSQDYTVLEMCVPAEYETTAVAAP